MLKQIGTFFCNGEARNLNCAANEMKVNLDQSNSTTQFTTVVIFLTFFYCTKYKLL